MDYCRCCDFQGDTGVSPRFEAIKLADIQPVLGGCLRGPEDPRDYLMLCGSHLGAASLPTKVDLRYLCSPVENQRELSSCTANACVGALEMLEKQQGIPQEDLSRLYVYWNTRILDGSVDKDQGAYLSTSMRAIQKHGACLESMWPYDPTEVFSRPHDQCYADGALRQTLEYARVSQGYGIKAALAEGFSVVFGMMLRTSFSKVNKTGQVPIPKKREKSTGGHAMLIVGYNMRKSTYIVRNSWGAHWGHHGYCYVPFQMVDDPRMSWDFWVARKIEEPAKSYKIHKPNI